MGRRGISYGEVSKAANQLKEEGIHPTVDKVRLLLGTGSKSTIVPYLRKWRLEQSDTTSFVPHTISPLFSNEPFSFELIEVLKGFLLHLQAETFLEPEIRSLKGQLYELLKGHLMMLEKRKMFETEKQGLKKEVEILQEKLRQTERDKACLIQDRIALKEELKKLEQGLQLC